MSSDRPPLVEVLTDQHRRHVGAAADLITVCATPNGVASYLAGAPDAPIGDIRHERGAIVTRAWHADYGTLLAVLGGPTVVEVVMHKDAGQRDAYRAATATVDAEIRAQMLASVQAAAVGMLRELGVTVEDDPEAGDE